MKKLHHMLRAAAGAGVTPPVATDPYFMYNTLLLHGDGTNGAQNNTFIDSSSNNFTITRNGNTTQGTFSPYGDLWSNYQPNSAGQGLTVPTNTALNLGTGNFTIEAWVNTAQLPTSNSFTTSAGGYQCIFGTGPNNASTGNQLYIGTTNILFDISSDGSGPINVAHGFSSNVWYHIALTRNGNTFRLFKDGVLLQSATSTASWNDGYGFQIGGAEPVANGGFTGAWWYGYISNFRIVKGTALYTSNFTPSTTPLTAVSGTSLLTCQSNRFKDNSSNNFTLTVTGTPSVQRFSPFEPSAAYSPSVIGGSGYFNGSTDYLNLATNALPDISGAFTYEEFVYPISSLSSNSIQFGTWNNNTGGWGVFINKTAWNGMYVFWYFGNYGSGECAFGATENVITLNSWNHIVIQRDNSNVWNIYVNGLKQPTKTYSSGSLTWSDSRTFTDTSSSAGFGTSTHKPQQSYISNARLVTGTAVYTADFTPPTAPLTAITNTSLLLNCVNAGIFDNAMMNDLVTVGNAQVSTSVKKYGTGSMAFDGAGDWLTSTDSPNGQIGSGNFTIEGWVYLSATGVVYGLVSKGTSTTGFSFGVNASNQLVFNYTTSALTASTALSATTWYYVTVVRNGTATGNVKIYLNGNVDATSSGAITDNFNQTNMLYIGADRTGANALNGYLDDVRITKGYARYTANFTPPTAALPDY